jgi:uncharacterized protein DUF6511
LICAICRRQPRGFGWFDPASSVSDPRRDESRRRFCSLRCLNLFARRAGRSAVVDPTELEQAAMAAALGPLGEYVGSIGMDRPLTDYSREEVLTLIEVVVTAFQDHLIQAETGSASQVRLPASAEVPF